MHTVDHLADTWGCPPIWTRRDEPVEVHQAPPPAHPGTAGRSTCVSDPARRLREGLRTHPLRPLSVGNVHERPASPHASSISRPCNAHSRASGQRFRPIHLSISGAVTRPTAVGRWSPRRQPTNALHYRKGFPEPVEELANAGGAPFNASPARYDSSHSERERDHHCARTVEAAGGGGLRPPSPEGSFGAAAVREPDRGREQDHRGPAPRHNPPRSPADCFQQAPGRAAGWVCCRCGEPRRLPSDDPC